jgi:hypothetical protein
VAKKSKAEQPKEYTRRQLSHAKKAERRQRIITFTGIGIIAAVLLIILGGWIATEYYPLHRTILTVNDTKFNVGYYIQTMEIMRKNDPTVDTGTLSNNAYQVMLQGEVLRQAAQGLGISASSDEITKVLKTANAADNAAARGFYGDQLVASKMQNDYFASKVPAEDKQVHAQAMMLESAAQAQQVRDLLASGGNFTELDSKYDLNPYVSDNGDYGWHVLDALRYQVSAAVPADWAFSADAGALSEPLADNVTPKNIGYWLINVLSRTDDGEVDVQALLISDNATAQDVREQLIAGTDNITTLADKYSQYTAGAEKHGQLGLIDTSNNSTFPAAFNSYAFSPDTPTGVWSQPILDKTVITTGGSWLVQVVEKDDKRAVSDSDKSILVAQAFNGWFNSIASDPNLKLGTDLLTTEIRQWAMNRVDKAFPPPAQTNAP